LEGFVNSATPSEKALAVDPRVPTSQALRELLDGADPNRVSIRWLLDSLSERSFGIVMLLLGIVAMVPGVSGIVGVLVAIPAVQMILAHKAPVFPRFISRRQVPTQRLARLIGRVEPILRRLERIIRPRWQTPIQMTKRAVGAILLLLGGLLLVPIPFSNLVPALVIVLLAFAYLEEDGVLLCVALVAALTALAVAAVIVWGTIKGIDLIDPKTPRPD
jgi:hypothetical protein